MLGLSEARTRALLKEMVSEGSITTSGGTKKKVYYKQSKKETSDIVYHYCSLEAFLSIIQNASLWLSDISKSNDEVPILQYCLQNH